MATKETVYKQLRDQWKIDTDVIFPLGFETIFRNLEQKFWPALPESYEWRIEENGDINLYKHKDAPKRHVEFVTYFTDSLDRFNFLSRWDGATQHLFAYTREDFTSKNLRKTFPVDFTSKNLLRKTFPLDFPDYWCGHYIDYLDTQGISELSICPGGHGSINVESISILDSRNYIPEPLNSYWSRNARTILVKEIRLAKGSYAQYMYYAFSPGRINGKAIPWGIYFVQVTPELASYSVPWPQSNYPIPLIHLGTDGNWRKHLRSSFEFFPCSFCA